MPAFAENLLRDNIRRLRPYSSARSEFKGAARIFLDANENPFDNGLNRYPDPLQRPLKARIAALRGIQPEQIFLGNGSDEAIDLLVRLFCEPGLDRIITLPPTYGMYEVCAGICGVEVVQIPLTAGFQPDVEAILAASDGRSKLLFVCSPNNPTGNAFDTALLQALLRGFPGIVVVDEAYGDFSSRPGALPLIDEYENLVVLQTFSKAWGLAGIRLGMAFAQAPLIEWFNKVKPPYNVNQLTQNAAMEALREPELFHRQLATILAERAILEQALPLLPMVEQVFPSDANFILVKTAEPNDLYRHLVSAGIIVRNRSSVILCEGCLRITVGTPEENRQLLDVLKQYATA
ncbi:MAG: histidinol-phosphate transaminase [Saprospiraceae bacterium]|nr:histidinol-phosphate transaminase [Saprospiraceae bacterium]